MLVFLIVLQCVVPIFPIVNSSIVVRGLRFCLLCLVCLLELVNRGPKIVADEPVKKKIKMTNLIINSAAKYLIIKENIFNVRRV